MFIIKIDHANLKYLREHKIATALHKKCLYKLMGFDFFIEYKQGKANLVSRKYDYMADKEESEAILNTLVPQVKPA